MTTPAGFVWDTVQQYQIHRLEKGASGVEEAVARDQGAMKADLRQFEERMNKLVLICKATFELLAEATGVTEQQLAERILEIDLRDGKADGRMTPEQKRCPDCGAAVCAKFNRCLFCGWVDASGDVFHTV